jgi:hypothetical protein
MNDDLERKFLIDEIMVLEDAVLSTGRSLSIPADPTSLEEFSTSDLRAVKQRLERLVRSLGGIKGG